MDLLVEKSALRGRVSIPGSKSHTIRAVAIGSLAEGHSVIRSPLISEDTLSAVQCYRSLGAGIDTDGAEGWHVRGTGGRVMPPG